MTLYNYNYILHLCTGSINTHQTWENDGMFCHIMSKKRVRVVTCEFSVATWGYWRQSKHVRQLHHHQHPTNRIHVIRTEERSSRKQHLCYLEHTASCSCCCCCCLEEGLLCALPHLPVCVWCFVFKFSKFKSYVVTDVSEIIISYAM